MRNQRLNPESDGLFYGIRQLHIVDVVAMLILLWYNQGLVHFNGFTIIYVYLLFVLFAFLTYSAKAASTFISRQWPVLLFLLAVFPSAIIVYGFSENNIHEVLGAIIILSIAQHYSYDNNLRKGSSIAGIILLDRLLVCISSIIRLASNPELSRDLAQGSTASALSNISIFMIGGYAFVYSSLILLVALIAMPKDRRLIYGKLPYTICIVLLFVFLIAASYTIAVVLASIFILFLLMMKLKNKTWRAISLLSVLPLSGVLLLVILPWLADQPFISQILSAKLHYLYSFLTGESIDGISLFSRFQLYGMSTAYMKDYFWFGSFENPAVIKQLFGSYGVHTEWTSMIGLFGIFRYCFFIFFMYKQYKCDKRICSSKRVVNFSYLLLLIIGFINPIINNQVFLILFFLIPYLMKRTRAVTEGERNEIIEAT